MSLLDEAKGLAKRSGGTCGVTVLVSRLSQSEQDELHEALAADISARALSEALRARGHDINYQVITRHRAGNCACR